MSAVLFTNARVFDGESADCAEGMNVLVEGGFIREIGPKPIATKHATRTDRARCRRPSRSQCADIHPEDAPWT